MTHTNRIAWKMLGHFVIVGLFLFGITEVLQGQTFEWARSISGTSQGNTGNSIAIDSLGNVYTTGYFSSVADFDPSPDTFNLTSAGSEDVFVSKLNSSGSFVWALRIGGQLDDAGYSLAVNPSGEVYITGTFYGKVDFDPGADTSYLISVGEMDIFVLKLDSMGNFIWAKRMGSQGGDYGNAIAIDNSGNVYTTGYFAQNADFDPGIGTSYLKALGGWDLFISKLDSSGNLIWAKGVGVIQSNTRGHSIFVDNLGGIYVTGRFGGTVDFDPGAGVFNLKSAGGNDIYVLKLDTLGGFIWAKSIGGASEDIGTSIAVDSSGNVYLAGYFSGTVNFILGSTPNTIISNGNSDILILKLDASGGFVWANSIGGIRADFANSIAVDSFGGVYITGFYQELVDFDNGPNTSLLRSKGLADVFFLKLDSSGSLTWAKSIGGTSSEMGNSINIDSRGNIYTTGNYRYLEDFDPGPGIFSPLFDSGIFVHKMSQK